jgi:acyl-CoA dehydrogenase
MNSESTAGQGRLFPFTDRGQEMLARVRQFMRQRVAPREAEFQSQIETGPNPWTTPPVLDELKRQAKAEGLWNLFLPGEEGFSNLDYAPMAEEMGRIIWASEVFNCNAPDTGNMEVLHRFGSPAQKQRWLEPLLAGEIRSCFAMTEPAVASSDATNIETRIRRDGDILRPLRTLGFDEPPHGHAEMVFEGVRVPLENMILGEGRGFEIAQGRLGPGRIHHCMRLIGLAERALEAMCARAQARVAFGRRLSEQGVVRDQIARSRIEIDQARLLVLMAAHKIDQMGAKAARAEIAMIKVATPAMAQAVLDRAIQVHGGGGLSQDFFLGYAFTGARILRIADGPDEVHLETVAKLELGRGRVV